jgi:hypothetical protein
LQPQPVQERASVTPAAPTVIDGTHIGNPIFRQAMDGLAASPNIPAGTINPDQRVSAAVALTASAFEAPEPLKAINTVILNRTGDRLIAVEGNLANSETCKTSSVGLDEARTASVRDCSDRVDTALQRTTAQPTLADQPAVQQDDTVKLAARSP